MRLSLPLPIPGSSLLRCVSACVLLASCTVAALAHAPAVSLLGDSPEAEVGKVRANFQLGRVREAISWATMAAGDHAGYLPGLAAQAFLEDRLGHIEQALARLSAARHGDDVSITAAQMEILLDRYAPDQALQLFRRWQGHHPDDPGLARLVARLRRVTGDASLPSATLVLRTTEPWCSTFAPAAGPLAPQSGPRGNGFIIDGGKQVVTTSDAVAEGTARVWLRDGLGRVCKATVAIRDPRGGRQDRAVLRGVRLQLGSVCRASAAGPDLGDRGPQHHPRRHA